MRRLFGSRRLGSTFDRPLLPATKAAGSASAAIVTGGVHGLVGAELRESAGAVTAWRIRDGSVTGTILCVLGAPANSTASAYIPDQGIQVLTGTLFAEAISGSAEIVVWYG